ncbi:MAG: AlkA N-terminal domain-containing protein [Naasia sp.]
MTRLLEQPLDPPSAEALRQFIVSHLVVGLDSASVDGTTVERSVDVGGRTHTAVIGWHPSGLVTVDSEADGEDAAVVAGAVSRWLDLPGPSDSELSVLTDSDRLAASVAARPGLRIPGAIAGLETALFAVLGQQVSLAAARTFAGRLVRFAGTDRGDGRFSSPSAARIAGAEPEEFRAALGITRARARTVQAVASAADGGLRLEPGADLISARRELMSLPGIGTWTTEYIALRCLGDRDAFPAGDLILRRQLGVVTEREALALGEAWRPARGLALLHIWTDAVFV